MPTFALAAQAADETGLPVAEGFAIQLKEGADGASVSTAATAAVNTWLPGYAWTTDPVTVGWLVCRPAGPTAVPGLGVPSLDKAWDTVRALKNLSGVASVEPLLLTRLPVTNGSDAQRNFRLWGTIDDARLAQIQAQSSDQHMRWSL